MLADPSSAHTQKWAKSLAEQGIEIYIFGLVTCNKYIYEGFPNIRISSLNIPKDKIALSNQDIKKLFFYASAIWRLQKIIKEFRPDIVHAHFATSYGLLAAIIGYHPLILSVWGSDILIFPKKSILHKFMIKFNLRKSDRILSTSQYMADKAKEYSDKNITITPFGIDLNRFTYQPEQGLFSANDIVIGTIKGLYEVYGIEYLLRAFEIIKNKYPDLPLKLLIVGGGPQESYLKEMAKDLGIADDTIFTGQVDYRRVPQYHNMISVFVALSNHESFGVSILEASASQRPVVVTNVGGFPEVVEDGRTGFMVPPRNPAAAAAALEKLIVDPALIVEMGRRGREKVRKAFDWENNVQQMVQIYEEVISEHNIKLMHKVVCHMTSVHRYNDTRIFLKECRSLSSAGYDTYLIAPNAPDSTVDGVQICGIKGENSGRFNRFTKTVWNVYKKAVSIDADIYHFHDPELLPIGLLLKASGKKVIYDVHEDLPRQILSKDWIPKRFRNVVSKIVEFVENTMVRYLDATVAATFHISKRFNGICKYAIDVDNYPILDELNNDDISWDNKENVVCYAGGLTAIRGVKEMVEATAMTKTRLLLAGEFSPAELKEEVQKIPNWEQVEFLGFLARPEVKKLYARSMAGLVVLYPQVNYIDAQPIKLFEYMSAGIPVIASNFPKWKEIVEGNRCGICVNPLDPEDIAGAINWIIHNPDEARKMGENGRRAVENGYNWENEKEKLIELYEQLSCK
jgi:glycosyltransferase involved in cell wall biosynthesis